MKNSGTGPDNEARVAGAIGAERDGRKDAVVGDPTSAERRAEIWLELQDEIGTSPRGVRDLVRDLLVALRALQPPQAQPPKDRPLPWRVETGNTPIADTGDYSGWTRIVAANGEQVAELPGWGCDEPTEIDDEAAAFIVARANAAPPAPHREQQTPPPAPKLEGGGE